MTGQRDIRRGYSTIRRSSISNWRRGVLSITRDISRIFQGCGLRNATRPSLSTSTSPKPRGRRLLRRSERDAVFVSVTITTSRSAKAARSVLNNSICFWYKGSNSLSAKTIRVLACQTKSFKFMSYPSKSWLRSMFQRSRTLFLTASWAVTENAENISKMKAVVDKNLFFIPLNIGCIFSMAKGVNAFGINNFIFKPLVRKVAR